MADLKHQHLDGVFTPEITDENKKLLPFEKSHDEELPMLRLNVRHIEYFRYIFF